MVHAYICIGIFICGSVDPLVEMCLSVCSRQGMFAVDEVDMIQNNKGLCQALRGRFFFV